MSIKLKILGMGLLALMATSAFAAMNASAVVPLKSHFTHEGPTENAIITAHEAKGTSHRLKFYHLKNGHETDGKPIECEKATYEGTVTKKTVQQIQLFPTYTNCATEGDPTGSVTVTPNGCSYTFFSGGNNTHGTVEVDCPTGKTIVIKHQNCEITVPAQTTAGTLTEGVTYDTVTEEVSGKFIHSLTATVTVNTITGHYHGGICIFLGTAQKFEMRGSVTVKGYEDLGGTPAVEGAQIGITHTESA